MALSIIEVDGHKLVATIKDFKIDVTLQDGTAGTFYIPEELKYPFPKPLSIPQIQGLWLITEGTVLPNVQPIPSWRIAEKLKMPPSNVSSR
jgi:hypothetical protein